jgi:hypothetical protein
MINIYIVSNSLLCELTSLGYVWLSWASEKTVVSRGL